MAAISAVHAASVQQRACPSGLGGNGTYPVPASLATAVITAFDVRMTPAQVMRQGVIRCANGIVLACLSGANLNCGKADLRRTSQGGTAWCESHVNSDFIPMFATGHQTVFAWRCVGSVAVPDKEVQIVDHAGYVAAYWRSLGTPAVSR